MKWNQPMALLLSENFGLNFQFVDLAFDNLVSTYPLFSTFHSLQSMSNYAVTPSTETASAMNYSETPTSDPVTKAVYDNVFGGSTPSQKKTPAKTVYCDVCALEFSSQVVLDTHLAGSKHQRKLKSKELMKSLEETESGFERNSVSGVIRCTVCDVTVNSPQLLATHMAGNKHKSRKGKRENGEDIGPPAKKQFTGASQSNGVGEQQTSGSQASKTNATAAPRKKERAPVTVNVPACVTKLEDTKAGGKFLCNPCQAHCNSDVQLSQHLSSKKHLEKVSGKKNAPPSGVRGGGRGRRGTNSYGRGRGGSVNRTTLGKPKWNTFSSSSILSSNTSSSNYDNPSLFSESGLSSSYSDSYGLSSLSRGSVTDYGFGRSGSSGRGGGGRGSGGSSYGRSESYSRSDGSYGRGVSAAVSSYPRTESYPHAEYGTEYAAVRAEEYSSYPRAPPTTEYTAPSYGADYGHGYGAGQSVSHAPPRGMPFTYTQPLSQNFVSGGSIL